MNLVHTSVLSAIETGVKLASGFLVLKYISVQTGPEGIAAFGQFQNFVTSATAMCAGAFTTGLVRYVSEAHEAGTSRVHVERAVGFALPVLVVFALALLIGPGLLSNAIFGSDAFAWAFVCLAIALPFIVLFQIILALFNGAGQIRELIISKSASSLLLLAISLVLVSAFGVSGGLASITLAPASAMLVALAMVGRVPGIDWSWFKPRLDLAAIRQFLPFWTMSMTTIISTPVVLILVRTAIGDQLGWTSAGYWEASWRLAELYLIVVTTALTVYYVPQLSRIAPGPQERQLVLRTLSFAIATSSVLALGIYLMRDIVVPLVFSHEFLPVSDILGPQLAGSVVRIGGWVVAYHMIVRGKVVAMVGSELFFGFTLYAATIYFTGRFGLIGASYAFLGNALAYAVFSTFYYVIHIVRPGR
ncbi:O-antigen translocase (plasmid) [Devosia neptuniae]|uniref:O-antigen translocase n=1 Tax=Devosia neptuniae TaxID=191302 RepID=A0ABY6C6C1_9HYPH|nr:O-antigen translocase [Devosia neptuniae]UXN67845.1 O-antigen translocase [Devosia neptuniae]